MEERLNPELLRASLMISLSEALSRNNTVFSQDLLALDVLDKFRTVSEHGLMLEVSPLPDGSIAHVIKMTDLKNMGSTRGNGIQDFADRTATLSAVVGEGGLSRIELDLTEFGDNFYEFDSGGEVYKVREDGRRKLGSIGRRRLYTKINGRYFPF